MPEKEKYARRKAAGICTRCGVNPAEEGAVRCTACLEYDRVYQPKHQPEYKRTPGYHERRREYRNTINGKFRADKNNAKQRKYTWELGIDQVGVIYTQPCHYCGETPNGTLNGIDRQDSTIGYIPENCVPCCPTCNYAKQQLSPEEFIWHCNKVAQFNKKQPTKDDRYNQLTIGK